MSQQKLNRWWSWGPLIFQKRSVVQGLQNSCNFIKCYVITKGGKPAKGFICLEKGKERQRLASPSFVPQRSRDEKTQGRVEVKKGQRQTMQPKERWKKMGCLVLDSRNDHLPAENTGFTKSPADSPTPSYFTHCLRILAWESDLVSSHQELNGL